MLPFSSSVCGDGRGCWDETATGATFCTAGDGQRCAVRLDPEQQAEPWAHGDVQGIGQVLNQCLLDGWKKIVKVEKKIKKNQRNQQASGEGTITCRKNVTPAEGARVKEDKHHVTDADATGIIFYKH